LLVSLQTPLQVQIEFLSFLSDNHGQKKFRIDPGALNSRSRKELDRFL
jgi:hypothetical protein